MRNPAVGAAGGDHAMTKDIAVEGEVPLLGADWFDPLEAGVRQRIRSFIENMLEEELAATLGRGRYDRSAEGSQASPWPLEAPVARRVRAVNGVGSSSTGDRQRWQAGGVAQQGAAGLQKRLTVQAERLIAGAYLPAHPHARGPARLSGAVRRGSWQGHREQGLAKVQSDWEAWQKRDLAEDDIARLILDGTVVRVRLDRKATSLSGCWWRWVFRPDGRKVLIALRDMGGESEAAWRALLDALLAVAWRAPSW